MAWQTPKTDWDPSNPEGVAGADFNRIEGNLDYLRLQDIEGNVYKTVEINGQLWTTENFRSTKYNDGTSITEVTDQTAWAALATPAYCKYNNYVTRYGLLYNWYVVDPANTKDIAPDGWRVPSNADITALDEYLRLNGYQYDYSTDVFKTAKSWVSNTDWQPDTGNNATPGGVLEDNNSSGVGLVPGGYRTDTAFEKIKERSYLWTTSESGSLAYHLQIVFNNAGIYQETNKPKTNGMSIRLVRDL